MGGHLYFVARTEAEGIELWRTDGTAAGTQLVHDIQPGPGHGVPWVGASLTAFGGRVYLQADDGVTGMELWSSDGTGGGTALVEDIAPGAASSNLAQLTASDSGNLFFIERPQVF